MRHFCIQSKNLTKISDRPLISDISFAAYSGEIHAIVGNNGEGKTVFANLLAGVRQKTSGSIFLNNKQLDITDVVSAQKHGIYMLQQEQVLFPNRSVRDNIIVGNERQLKAKGFWTPSKKQMDKVCRQTLEPFGLGRIDLNASISSLGAMEKLIIQFCRILICKPTVLILDEPSTSLANSELKVFFEFLEKYKTQAAIILITHNYSLLMRYCDRVSVIDDGKIVASFVRDEFSQADFVSCITQMKMNFSYPKLPHETGRELLSFNHLSSPLLKDFHFSMREGEMIGLARDDWSCRIESRRAGIPLEHPHWERYPCIRLDSLCQ